MSVPAPFMELCLMRAALELGFTFTPLCREHQLPFLEGEIFDSVKPGLSAFVDQPKQGAETVQELLEVAKDSIPRSHWKRTPVVLKATAGLRLLPEQKAQTLLLEVTFESGSWLMLSFF